jgi:hypothetical protein
LLFTAVKLARERPSPRERRLAIQALGIQAGLRFPTGTARTDIWKNRGFANIAKAQVQHDAVSLSALFAHDAGSAFGAAMANRSTDFTSTSPCAHEPFHLLAHSRFEFAAATGAEGLNQYIAAILGREVFK